MSQNPRRDIAEYIVPCVLILLYSFGVFMFIIAVGLEGAAKIGGLIIGGIGLLGIIAKFFPMLAYYAFVAVLGFVVLYGLGGWELIRYAFAFVVLVLFFWGIYAIGDRYGWWKDAYPRD